MNQIAIGLSIILGFLFSEFLGLACGGMISAGYLALFIESPLRLVFTVCCALLVYLIVIIIQKFAIIYGRRRFALCVLLGFCLTFLWSKIIPNLNINIDIRIVGFIIPGLIANGMVKQGIVRTVIALAVTTILVKLILLLGIACNVL